MPRKQALPIFTLAMNACNDSSESGISDLRTGATQYIGLNAGDYFDLTEKEANQLSYIASGYAKLHAGRYRRVQVDSGATAAYVKTGAIGYMVAGLQPELNIVTSYDKGIVGVHTVVFLNAITPGNFGFVQELGIASCLCGTSITSTGTAGDPVNAVATGVIDRPSNTIWVPAQVGICLDPPNPRTLIRVAMTAVPVQG